MDMFNLNDDDDLIYLDHGNPYGVVGYVTKKELKQLERELDESDARLQQLDEAEPTLLNGKVVLH